MISRPYSVLIVDDEPEMCELLDTILAHHFQDILILNATSSTEEAIKLLEKNKQAWGKTPDTFIHDGYFGEDVRS